MDTHEHDNHELARLTADVAAFAYADDAWHVLLIRRRWEPFTGLWALPGGHVDAGERFPDAAMRELAEETGVTADALYQVGIYDHPGRDPRGRYVTAAYVAVLPGLTPPLAGDDAATAEWVPLDTALCARLAFDHARILADAAAVLVALTSQEDK
ncbi:NUDIX domain-containing protein [Amycolatopsis sp. NPDC054798]